MQMRDFPCRDTAVDLGSSTIRMHVRGHGIVASEPALMATCLTTGRTLAVGAEALRMHAGAPRGVGFAWPFEAGAPTDLGPAERLLRHLLRGTHRRRYLAKPRLAISVSAGITGVQRNAVKEVAYRAGARQLAIVPAAVAAALGAGLTIDGPAAVMVVDVGAARTDIAVMAYGQVVCSTVVRVAGEKFDRAIAADVRARQGIILALRTAEAAKMSAGAVGPQGGQRRQVLVYGCDLRSGLPEGMVLSSHDISRALAGSVAAIARGVRSTLAQVPPELASDLMTGGITLTGGSAQLRGLDALLRAETGLTVRVAENAATAVVTGTARHLAGPGRRAGRAEAFAR